MKTLLAAVITDRSTETSIPRRRLFDRFPDSSSTSNSSSTLTGSMPTQLPFGRRSTDFVECPKCGKRSIVARTQNTFDCLNCNFHRELPPVVSPNRSAANRLVTRQFPHRANSPNSTLSRPLNPLMSSGSYRSPLELDDIDHESDSNQPLLFAALAVIFGILLL